MTKHVKLTGQQLSTLRHMLGITDPAVLHPRSYRNYAAATPGDPEFLELERLGMVSRIDRPTKPFSEYEWYRCTDMGISEAFRSHCRIRYPRSERRYVAFLRLREALPDLTFKEFLIRPEFEKIRREQTE